LRENNIRAVSELIRRRFQPNILTALVTCHGGFERSRWVTEWMYRNSIVVPSKLNIRNNYKTKGCSYNEIYPDTDLSNINICIFCIDFPEQKIGLEEAVWNALNRSIETHMYLSGGWNEYRKIQDLVE